MLLNLLTLPAALYLIIAGICMANRMSRRTRHYKRFIVVGLAYIGAFSLLKTIRCEWEFNAVNVALALLVILTAIVLRQYPRVRV